MRLLDTETGQFRDDVNPMNVPYAILSHRWEGREQTYQEVCAIQAEYREQSIALILLGYLRLFPFGALPHSRPPYPATRAAPLAAACMGLTMLWMVWITPLALAWATAWDHYSALTDPRLSPKIRNACAYAFANGHRYLWIDSCCIDKTSSTELSESINSMYRWYELADVCFAYLSDVPGPGLDRAAFHNSEWHNRGWTLQELLAPDVVIFLSAGWEFIGTKSSLVDLLRKRLDIDALVLTKFIPIRQRCAAEVMSWAALRKTTREEDMAYCLMGLFGVRMPALYGEGGKRAFVRLQQEIWQAWRDPSIFAWEHDRPASTKDLNDCYLNDATEATSAIEHRGQRRTRPLDYISHYATSPMDFFGDYVSRLDTDALGADFSSIWSAAKFGSSGWVAPLSYGAPSPVPYAPLSTFLPPPGSDNPPSPTLSDLYLVLLPCLWRQPGARTPTGLLAIVCSLRSRIQPLSEGPDTPPAQPHALTTFLQPVTLHNDTDRSSRLVLLDGSDIEKLHGGILFNGSLFCDPFRACPPRSVDIVRHAEVYQTAGTAQTVMPRVQPADWVIAALSVQGYEVTPVSISLPPPGIPDVSGAELISEFKLRKDDLTIVVQYRPPSTLIGFSVLWRDHLPMRIGSEVLDSSQGAVSGSPARWNGWDPVAVGASRWFELGITPGRGMLGCRVTLRYHTDYDYRLIIDVFVDPRWGS